MFYVSQNNQPSGPFSAEDIGAMVKAGSVNARTLIVPVGNDNWMEANSIETLSHLFSVAKSANATQAASGSGSQNAFAIAVYILYFVQFVFPPTAFVGIVIAYIMRGSAPEWIRTHFQLQIRTFWIAMVYLLLPVILALSGVGLPLAGFLGLLVSVWEIIRCGKGVYFFGKGKSYPNPTTWLW